jgi:hypothetical protein
MDEGQRRKKTRYGYFVGDGVKKIERLERWRVLSKRSRSIMWLRMQGLGYYLPLA